MNVLDIYQKGKLFDLVNIYRYLESNGIANPIEHIEKAIAKEQVATNAQTVSSTQLICPACGGLLLQRVITVKKGRRNKNGYRYHVYCAAENDCVFEEYALENTVKKYKKCTVEI